MTCIDHTSKWVEYKALVGETAEGVVQLMYEFVCYFGAARIHISNQVQEFVDQVCVPSFLSKQSHYM